MQAYLMYVLKSLFFFSMVSSNAFSVGADEKMPVMLYDHHILNV